MIDEVIYQTVGTGGAVIGPSGGTQANTDFWSVGPVAQYIVRDVNTDQLIGLQVSASNPTGALLAGTDSLMVARTVDSQGLTDNGTLSVYVWRPHDPKSNWTLDLTFSFFALDENDEIDLLNPYDVDLLLTSLDIDNNQLYYTLDDDFESNHLYGTTQLVSAPSLTDWTGWTASTSAAFDDPEYAVSSLGTGNSFTVKIGHDTQALYMFEFRNPSSIIPEPGTSALVGLGSFVLIGFLRRTRRLS